MNLIILLLMCVRLVLATPLAVAAYQALDWDQPDMFMLVRSAMLAGLTGGFWLSTFWFALSPGPAATAGRMLFDTLASVGMLAAFTYYDRRRIR